MTNPILIIHPKDSTTTFLDRIKKHVIDRLKPYVHHFNVYPNDQSHAECLERIAAHPTNGIIIFLGHGRSNKLFGSKGNLFHTIEFASTEAISENPELYYNNDDFINLNNIAVFKGKKVFCLACNSNQQIACSAIEHGAKAFLGFGDIPTSTEEFRDVGISDVSSDIVKLMKTELNYIIKIALEYSLTRQHTFEQLQNIINIITNQRISEILIAKKEYKDRYILADHLYYLKRGALVMGDKRLMLFN